VKDKTTFGLSPERLARLLAIGLESSEGQHNSGATRSPADVLQEMLTGKLPLDLAMPDSLPAVLKRPCDELLAVAGRTMCDVLLNSGTDLAVIKALKNYGKELVRCGGPKAKQAAATVIYYAAIGSALVFHQNRITGHSYEKLEETYADLQQRPWIPSELKDLFRRALAICQQPKGKTK